MTSLRCTALTDVGPVRKNNQDSGYASPRLLVLADGMGGQAAGDLASAVAVQTVRRLDPPPQGDVLEALAGAIHRANDRLGELVEEDASIEGMGTTLIAMAVEDADSDNLRLVTAHVGDSRAYLSRAGELSQITTDHTFVQSLVDEGRISAAEARTHPHRSLILRALQGGHSVEPDLSRLNLVVGDRVLLCSDGLSDYVDPDVIGQTLAEGSIEEVAERLVRLALEAGTTDNVTVVIGEVVSDQDTGDVEAEPVLVGSAAAQGSAAGDSTDSERAVDSEDEEDLEELRYAPRSHPRRRGLIRTVVVAVVVLVVGLGAMWAYNWSQSRYYVGDSDGTVAVFRGIPLELAGLNLSEVHHDTDLMLDDLPEFSQQQIREGIEIDDLPAADEKLAELRQLAADCRAGGQAAAECAEQDPATEPSPTGPSPTGPTNGPPSGPTSAGTNGPTRTDGPGGGPGGGAGGGGGNR